MKDTRKYMTEGEIAPDDMAGEVARLREGAKLPEAGWRLADGSPRTLSQLAESWRESQNEEYPEDRRCFADWLEGEIQEFRVSEPGFRVVKAVRAVMYSEDVVMKAPEGVGAEALESWFGRHRDDGFWVRQVEDLGCDVEWR